MPLIATRLDDAIGTITLDYPAKRNALSEALIQEVIAALADFRERKARAVVLRAQPGRQGVVGRTRRRRAADGRPRSAGVGRSAAQRHPRDRALPGAGHRG